MRYLSPEWLATAAEALDQDADLRDATAGVALTLEQVVTGGPKGTIRWHIVLHDGDNRLIPGPAPNADLRFTTTWPTACAIARGEVAAPTAFMEGSLQVGGDLVVLINHQQKLSAIDDVLGDLRSGTTFD